jgi:RNA polymerase sigma factor (sigma-70 family)
MQRYRERALWLARNVLPHEPMLRAWLQKRLVPGIDPDDIVQETYARLSLLESVDDIREVRGYLVRTAHSAMIDLLRRSQVVPINSLARLEDLDTALDELDPETIALDRDELGRLAIAIAQLPARTGEVFTLRRVHGLSQREVAERLGIAESTVEKLMSKGFHRLSALFGRGGKSDDAASNKGGHVGATKVTRDYAGRDQPGD